MGCNGIRIRNNNPFFPESLPEPDAWIPSTVPVKRDESWYNHSVPKPTRKEEQALWAKGQTHVAGADEAGKGSWAGPIVAAAVILPPDFDAKIVNDSKVLSPKQREKMFVHIVHRAVSWAVAVIPSEYIDRRGIKEANVKVLEQAVRKLHIKPHAVLVDAVKITPGKKPVKAIIDGDAKVLCIAAASILAKVARDALMQGEHRLYPHYDFPKHKGYGTDGHLKALKKHGLSPIHRRSFHPMKTMAPKKFSHAPLHNGTKYHSKIKVNQI